MAEQKNPLISDRDVAFVLYEVLDSEALCTLPYFAEHSRETFDMTIDAWRRLDIVLAIGRDDPMRENNEYFSRALWEKGVGNALRLWDGWAHDWPWWREMVVRYVGGHD